MSEACDRVVEACGPLTGEITPPGDKSISHRCLMLGALANGPVRMRRLLDSADVRATAHAMEALGATLSIDGDAVVLTPPERFADPSDVIDCGNSGTTIRLLTGLIAAENVFAVLNGDASLRGRPMSRVVGPLRLMGAKIEGRLSNTKAPLCIRGPLTRPMAHDLPLSSAQVKSALLLGGRHVGVSLRETRSSRDHTERLLTQMGARLKTTPDGWMQLRPFETLDPFDVMVPGDLSSASFWMVAGSIIPGSEIVLRNVGINPTRAGVIDALKQMGARIEVQTLPGDGEPTADLRIKARELVGTTIEGDLALRSIDELPVLAVAAAFATGETIIRDVAELRVKESDRIARTVDGLKAMGVEVDEQPDGMIIQGGSPKGPGVVDASGDHRIAMAFAVAGLAAGPVTLLQADSSTSYPGFWSDLEALRA
ncbi:MAG: 3-phosphoshikimate 1-carboxyvinyltransferase [Myxococcota bacterium]